MWRGARSPVALVVLVCAACGASASPSGPSADRQWIANAHGTIVQLRDDVIVAAGIDPRRALHDDSSLYTALVVFTDFGGCRHMVGALGSVPRRFARANGQLRLACAHLQRAAALFTRAVGASSVNLMRTALETAQRALVPLDRAELALRRE